MKLSLWMDQPVARPSSEQAVLLKALLHVLSDLIYFDKENNGNNDRLLKPLERRKSLVAFLLKTVKKRLR